MARVPVSRIDIAKVSRIIRASADETAAVAALRDAGLDAENTGECGCFYDGFCGEDIIAVTEWTKATKANRNKPLRKVATLRFLGANGDHVDTSSR